MKLGFLGALCLLFIGLKLAEVITWSWWLVLLPIWGPIALLVAFFMIVGLMFGFDKIKVTKKDV